MDNHDCSDGSQICKRRGFGTYGLCFVLIAVAAAALFGAIAVCDDSDAIDDGKLNYVKYDSKLYVKGIHSGNMDTCITIPAEVWGMPVVEVNESAFKNLKRIHSVVFAPGGDIRIGMSAFEGCTNLKSIDLSDSVYDISNRAFYGCLQLKDVTILDKLTAIGPSAFSGCTSLKNVTIPGTVEWVQGRAFLGCNELTSVTMGEGVERIGTEAFKGCTNLSQVYIPGTVTYIELDAFSGCALTWVGFGQGPENLYMAYNAETGKSAFPVSIWDANESGTILELKIYDNSAVYDDIAIRGFSYADNEARPGDLVKMFITFDPTPGQLSSYSDRIKIADEFGNVISIPSAELPGSNMDGWMTSDRQQVSEQYPFREFTTVHVHWTCDVTFDANGHGTAPAAESVDFGSPAVRPSDPVCIGYAFGGWFIDEGCVGKWDFNAPVSSSITLYAKWTEAPVPVKCKVVFDANGHGTAPSAQELDTGTKATRPADPTCDGYRFIGWYKEASCVNAWDFETVLYADVTLYAKWAAVEKVKQGESAKIGAPVDVSKFQKITVDGKDLGASNYKKNASGNIEIEISAEYVKTLSSGEHTLVIKTTDGDYNAVLIVSSAGNSDSNNIQPWVIIGGCLGIIALAIIVVTVIRRKN